MKTTILKIKAFAVAALVMTCASQAGASWGARTLDLFEQKFDQATTIVAKREIASLVLNERNLFKEDLLEKWDTKALAAGVGSESTVFSDPADGKRKFNYEKTTPLMMAITAGRVGFVQKLLDVIPDVNDNLHTSWGYRQPYAAAHMALEPMYPFAFGNKEVPIEDRLSIIDLLGAHKADFNKRFDEGHMGIYTNPPLAAGTVSQQIILGYERLQARAMLYGADPKVQGSCFTMVTLNETEEYPVVGTPCKSTIKLIDRAYDEYKVLSKKGVKMTLAECVKDRFRVLRDAEIKALLALPF
jgi:hypothetical protein